MKVTAIRSDAIYRKMIDTKKAVSGEHTLADGFYCILHPTETSADRGEGHKDLVPILPEGEL